MFVRCCHFRSAGQPIGSVRSGRLNKLDYYYIGCELGFSLAAVVVVDAAAAADADRFLLIN